MTTPSVGPPQRQATPKDVEADDEVVKARADALANLRRNAARWAASVSAVLAVFASATVVKGPADAGIPAAGAYRDPLGIALGVGLALALAAVGLASLAAQETTGRTTDLPAARHRAARTAAWQLRWSKRAAFLAAVSLLAALGLTWIAGGRGDEVQFVRRDGQTSCGTLVPSTGGVSVTDDSGTVPFNDVLSVRPAKDCP